MIQVQIQCGPCRNMLALPRRWNTKGVNWITWASNLSERSVMFPNDVDTLNDTFISKLNLAAESVMKLSSPKLSNHNKTPWWNDKCKIKVKNRRQARKKCEKHPLMDNFVNYKKCSAEAKFVIRKSKKESWHNYVKTLSNDTPITKVWEKIKKIKNTYKPTNFPIIVDNLPILDNKNKSNEFMKYFSKVKLSDKIVEPDNINDT